VHPDHQGGGLGAILLRHAEALAAAGGCRRVALMARPHNTGARRFYLREGYRCQPVDAHRLLYWKELAVPAGAADAAPAKDVAVNPPAPGLVARATRRILYAMLVDLRALARVRPRVFAKRGSRDSSAGKPGRDAARDHGDP